MKYKSYLSLLFICFLVQSSWSQLTVVDSLKAVLKTTKVDTTRVNLYNQLAFELKESRPDIALTFAQQAATLADKKGFVWGKSNALINQGNLAIINGDFAKAQKLLHQSELILTKQLEQEPNHPRYLGALARTNATLGVILSQQSNYYGALEAYFKALELFQKIQQKPMIAKAYNNIGVVYKSQGNRKKALDYFKKALVLQQEIGEPSVPVTLTNVGVIYFELKQFPKALSYYQKADIAFASIANVRGQSLLYNYLGDYYVATHQEEKAKTYYEKALAGYESIQNPFGAALALYNLGLWHQQHGTLNTAMQMTQKSLAYAEQIGVLDQMYHSEKLLSELYSSMGDASQSLEHYKKFIVARDSIRVQENNKKFLEAEMNFEYKKRAALLAEQNKRHSQLLIFTLLGSLLIIGLILVIYNRSQVKKRLTLEKELAEYEQKALHLQMNPHFVFNCLGSISSFIVQNGTDQALKYLAKFSKLMRLTLEYSKGSLIPIDKEIESLENYLELEQLRFHNKFDFTIHATDKVEFNMGIPPLLIQPFVENAILHGLVPKESKGSLHVEFDVQHNQLICTVTDNGIGITQSQKIKAQSMQAHKSMALEITRKRLEIMEATIAQAAQIEINELTNLTEVLGTQVRLRLPIQYIS